MGWVLGLGNGIVFRQGGSQNLSSYWTRQSEVLFFGLYSEISGGQMPNKVDGGATYLTVAGSAGSETYQCPNTAAYIAADTDYIWFKQWGVQRTVTTAELIGYDLQHTPIYYEDDTPNSIVAIIILKENLSASKLLKLHHDFRLPILWSGAWIDDGYEKSNRPLSEQYLWTPESFVPTDLTLTRLALTDFTSSLKIDWTDNSEGVAETEVWGKNDSDEYALLYTIAAGTITKTEDGLTPVDLRYIKLRCKYGLVYSAFTSAVSKALLSEERLGAWATEAYWTTAFETGWSADGSKLSHLLNNATRVRRASSLTIGVKYRVKTTMTGVGTSRCCYGNTGDIDTVTAPHTDEIRWMLASSTTLNVFADLDFAGDITAMSMKGLLGAE
jgi:hypothetical protein